MMKELPGGKVTSVYDAVTREIDTAQRTFIPAAGPPGCGKTRLCCDLMCNRYANYFEGISSADVLFATTRIEVCILFAIFLCLCPVPSQPVVWLVFCSPIVNPASYPFQALHKEYPEDADYEKFLEASKKVCRNLYKARFLTLLVFAAEGLVETPSDWMWWQKATRDASKVSRIILKHLEHGSLVADDDLPWRFLVSSSPLQKFVASIVVSLGLNAVIELVVQVAIVMKRMSQSQTRAAGPAV
eukprot:TRINITY_DN16511_c0_g2_i1.p1 TRINITY_DN16511_c0_g2~~TRINITY_DN16511_c0_g2_i1.p1  ORF type:complete len:243 (+),score=-16.62 TRINITY_DN16511_c0_g2_i1:666-1394(+)